MTKRKDREFTEEANSSFGGIFKGLADLIDKLGDLAEKGEELRKAGEFQGESKDIKGVYGFSVKVGLGEKGEKGIKVEPFGNVRKDARSGETKVQEIREPVVDVFEEKGYTLVVAEIPGISADDVQLSVQDDLLTIYAEKADKKYRKEILLPRSYPREKMTITCNNGILEIKCVK
jgi:HSP20 family protein